jgi:hypothetical protein
MIRTHLLLAALLTAVGLPAHSQPTGSPPSASTQSATAQTAGDAQATVPKFSYRSPFATYRADKIEETRAWRDVNDRVGAIGGWRVYAREAQPAAPTPPAPALQSPTAPRN